MEHLESQTIKEERKIVRVSIFMGREETSSEGTEEQL
jgi:hypothetical protein